jgi:hypothetical protein
MIVEWKVGGGLRGGELLSKAWKAPDGLDYQDPLWIKDGQEGLVLKHSVDSIVLGTKKKQPNVVRDEDADRTCDVHKERAGAAVLDVPGMEVSLVEEHMQS